MTKSMALLGDVLTYGAAAAVAQAVSHLVLARDPKLPESWEQLVLRYSAGSGIVASAVTGYVLRHPSASGQDVVFLYWGVLLSCGAAVAALHYADGVRERALAQALDQAFDQEGTGHVASPAAPRRPLPIPIRGRA